MKGALAPVTSPEPKRDPPLALVEVLFHVNFLSFDEKWLVPAYKHWAFLPRDTPLPLDRRDPITSQWQLFALLLTRGKVMLVFSIPGCNCPNVGALEMMVESGEDQDRRGNVYTVFINFSSAWEG